MKPVLLFDLDGVLWDSSEVHAKAFAEALALVGISSLPYSTIAGMRTEEAIEKAFRHAGTYLDPQAKLQIVRNKRALALKNLRNVPTKLVDLQRLMGRSGIKVGLVTGASREAVNVFLSSNVRVKFDCIVTAEDVTCGKPSPEPYLAALRILSEPPSNAIAFEDSHAGIESARAAGLSVVHVCPEKDCWITAYHECVSSVTHWMDDHGL